LSNGEAELNDNDRQCCRNIKVRTDVRAKPLPTGKAADCDWFDIGDSLVMN